MFRRRIRPKYIIPLLLLSVNIYLYFNATEPPEPDSIRNRRLSVIKDDLFTPSSPWRDESRQKSATALRSGNPDQFRDDPIIRDTKPADETQEIFKVEVIQSEHVGHVDLVQLNVVEEKVDGELLHKKLDPVVEQSKLTAVVEIAEVKEKVPPVDEHGNCRCVEMYESLSQPFIVDEMDTFDPFFNSTTHESIVARHPNLPLDVMLSPAPKCDLMPDFVMMDWVSVHWQRLYFPNRDQLLLYSAHYDNRTKTEPAGGAIRILVLYRGSDLTIETDKLPWCHIWYNGTDPPLKSRVIRAEYVDHQDHSKDRLQMYVLLCSTPPKKESPFSPKPSEYMHRVPSAVSLVNEPCDAASNLLKVIGVPDSDQPQHTLPTDFTNPRSSSLWNVAVCGPALFYTQEDYSLRLVEWLEILRAYAVPEVFLYYVGTLHPNVEKVLKYYETTKFVTLTDFRYPPPYIDEPLLRRIWTRTQRSAMFAMENMYFTDCVLRNKDRYRYIMRVDPDEIPILMDHETLPHLIEDLTMQSLQWTYPPQAFNMRWQNFPPVPTNSKYLLGLDDMFSGIPAHFHVLRHNRRLAEEDKNRRHVVKSIFDTRDATGITSHTLIVCASGVCNLPFKVKVEVAYIGHFRDACVDDCFEQTVEVPEVRKHKYEVIQRAQKVIAELRFDL